MAPIIAQRPRQSRDGRPLAVLILAAGSSRRLGRAKQLVRLDGEPLVRRTTRLATTLQPAWLGVVVGAHAGRVIAALGGERVAIVRSRRWRDGMAASLASGVRAVPRGLGHLLVLAADQWRLGAGDLAALRAAAGRAPAAAEYDGHVGIPALFPMRLRARLLALRGDRGARAVLEASACVRVPMPAAATDLDTPADLAQLRAAGRGR